MIICFHTSTYLPSTHINRENINQSINQSVYLYTEYLFCHLAYIPLSRSCTTAWHVPSSPTAHTSTLLRRIPNAAKLANLTLYSGEKKYYRNVKERIE